MRLSSINFGRRTPRCSPTPSSASGKSNFRKRNRDSNSPKPMTSEKRIWILTVSFWLLAAHGINAATKPAVPLRVAYSSISGSAIVPWIAVDKGLFAKYDLGGEWVYVAGSQAMQSLLSGTTPIGIQGIEPVLRVNVHGGETVMIVGLAHELPFSVIR